MAEIAATDPIPDAGTEAGTPQPQAGAVKLTMLLAGVVFLLMMTFGLLMRMTQGGLIEIDPILFYQLLTAHGAGMVGTAALTGAAILWYFMGRHVVLLDGRMAGSWRHTLRPDRCELDIRIAHTAGDTPGSPVGDAIQEAVDRYAVFMRLPAVRVPSGAKLEGHP